VPGIDPDSSWNVSSILLLLLLSSHLATLAFIDPERSFGREWGCDTSVSGGYRPVELWYKLIAYLDNFWPEPVSLNQWAPIGPRPLGLLVLRYLFYCLVCFPWLWLLLCSGFFKIYLWTSVLSFFTLCHTLDCHLVLITFAVRWAWVSQFLHLQMGIAYSIVVGDKMS
jgi:hypothetical protein